MRYALALAALLQLIGVLIMLGVHTPPQAYLAAAAFGAGIGGLLTLLPIAWADYYGRRSFGAIRGLALTVQVLAQAAGPLLSGVLRDCDRHLRPVAGVLRRAVGGGDAGGDGGMATPLRDRAIKNTAKSTQAHHTCYCAKISHVIQLTAT